MNDRQASHIKLNSLSIIFPAYNEEDNIAHAVLEAAKVAKEIAKKFEIIVVNDGSKDRTGEIVKNMSTFIPQIKIINQNNQGYGGALKTGFETAAMEWVFFTDSDLQFDIKELAQFIPHTESNPLIFGYRSKRADHFHRLLIAKALKIWNKIFLGFPLYVKDIDGAFKLMKKDVFDLASPLISDGAMINTEFILKLHQFGFEFKQIPVSHYPRTKGSSTGSNLSVIWKAVKETFELRRLIALNSTTINKNKLAEVYSK